MYDKDGNLINQIVLYDKNMANKEYGSQIGDYLFSNSSKQWQTINLNNSNETTNNTNNEISQDLVKEIEYKTRENNKNNSNVEYIPVYTLLNAKKNGGYRTPEQVQNLTDNIKTGFKHLQNIKAVKPLENRYFLVKFLFFLLLTMHVQWYNCIVMIYESKKN